MRRGVSFAGLLLAWLCAQGALTDGLQVLAWSRMFARYAETMAWRAALDETFDPSKPCEICGVVRQVRETEREQSPNPLPAGDAGKIVLFLSTAEIELPAAPPVAGFPPMAAPASEWCAPVPKPPPRTTRA